MNSEVNNEFEENEMTDKQYNATMIKTRIEELDRVLKHTKNEETIRYIEERKKELRIKLDKLF